jgi:hypothetical protein
MLTQRRLMDVLGSSDLKSAPAYRRAWERLRKGRDMADAVDALCDVDASAEWARTEFPALGGRQTFLAQCKWPLAHVPELQNHPAGARWCELHGEAVRESMAAAEARRATPANHVSHPDIAELARPTYNGGGDAADPDPAADSSTTYRVETVVDPPTPDPDPVPEASAHGAESADVGDEEEDEDDEDEVPPPPTPIVPPPALVGGGSAALNIAACVHDIQSALSFVPFKPGGDTDEEFHVINDHEASVRALDAVHAGALAGTFSGPTTRFRLLEWSGLRGTAPSCRVDFIALRGKVLVVSGRAADAPVKALAVAYSGAGEDELSRTLVSRQLGDRDSFGKNGIDKPRTRLLLEVDGLVAEMVMERVAKMKKPSQQPITREYLLHWDKQTLIVDDVNDKVPPAKWAIHLQERYGTFTPVFDVTGAINKFTAIASDSGPDGAPLPHNMLTACNDAALAGRRPYAASHVLWPSSRDWGPVRAKAGPRRSLELTSASPPNADARSRCVRACVRRGAMYSCLQRHQWTRARFRRP